MSKRTRKRPTKTAKKKTKRKVAKRRNPPIKKSKKNRLQNLTNDLKKVEIAFRKFQVEFHGADLILKRSLALQQFKSKKSFRKKFVRNVRKDLQKIHNNINRATRRLEKVERRFKKK